MSITYELRKWAKGSTLSSWTTEHLTAIADRIDAEHESVRAESIADMTDERMAEHGWARLPVDADGVPIHIGDVMDFSKNVTNLVVLGVGCCDNGDSDAGVFVRQKEDYVWYNASFLRHHHQPTVEDVLREFAIRAIRDSECGMGDLDETCAEYASKLRLAEEVDG